MSGPGESFDVVVIGAGSAGCAVAGRLAEDGRLSVCLIEPGGDNDTRVVKTPFGLTMLRHTRTSRPLETVPQPGLNGRTGYQPRGQGLGGSSAVNAMVYIRGNAWDYDNWAAMGATGWSYQDVLPWFRKAEGNVRGGDEFHGADGPLSVSDQPFANPSSLAFVEAAGQLQLGLNPDFNGARQDGFGLYQSTIRNGERWSAARAYLTPRANLDVRTGWLVERIKVEDGRATGVVVRRGVERREINARGAVVLSAGAFGSPQLLMCSGIGPAAHLAELGIGVVHAHDGVGANLHDHIDYVASFATRSKEPVAGGITMAPRMLRAAWDYHRRRTGLLASPLAEAGGFWRSRPDLPAPDIQYHFIPAILVDHGRETVSGHGYSIHACVLRPESRGTVRLASKDAAAAPLIDPAFLTAPNDIVALRAGARLAYRLGMSAPLDQFGPTCREDLDPEDDAALDALIRQKADTVYHPVGSCRMGSDADAVVDPRLRFNGIANLRVADASVMPQVVSGNTNAPSIMIGERCAQFLREELLG
ncbi:MAG: GMC family oxidoreductase N-terminal domain-containing protein [Proteobacteria bacterium]|nr:GMC family oxidoreductase N-terminal domain-containing protein [Pseudomonadota bacterium]